jgi:aromatic-L-amino-acid decarboxylase
MDKDESKIGEMNLDEFRQSGHQLVDWIADYLDHPEQYPVLSRSRPGEIRAQLPAAPPDRPESMATILSDFENIIVPGMTHWNHPGFFSYFGITGSGPGILGELLIAALNVNGMLWRTSPAATELEEVTLDWLRQMMGLPAHFQGIITDTASISSMLAIAAAREALNLDVRRQGMAGRADLPRLRMYISDQTHSSVEKGAITLGIGQEGVRKIATDDTFRMKPEALRKAIKEDIAAGWRPFIVTATVGTTATTSIDPVAEIGAICREHQLWLHVDAAYGGAAAIVPEMSTILDGAEQADSFVVNPHKWLFTPVDCSAFYVRDPEILKRTFALVPEYLKSSEEGVTNYMDWGLQLGRRFRALKLWMVIRHFGRDGLADRIREHIRLGQLVAGWVDADPDFERLAPTPFSTVCFRACPRDLATRLKSADQGEVKKIEAYLEQLNEEVIEAVNATGEVFISPTRLHGRFTIRMAIGNIRSDETIITRTWQLLSLAVQQIDAKRQATTAD